MTGHKTPDAFRWYDQTHDLQLQAAYEILSNPYDQSKNLNDYGDVLKNTVQNYATKLDGIHISPAQTTDEHVPHILSYLLFPKYSIETVISTSFQQLHKSGETTATSNIQPDISVLKVQTVDNNTIPSNNVRLLEISATTKEGLQKIVDIFDHSENSDLKFIQECWPQGAKALAMDKCALFMGSTAIQQPVFNNCVVHIISGAQTSNKNQ